jgi:hypothetical protein
LEDLLSASNLSGRQCMNVVSQICYSGFAHLLLMRDTRDDKLARLLLIQGEGRRLCLLGI